MLLGFIIWMLMGIFFIVLGIYCFYRKKAIGIWANDSEKLEVSNIRHYNNEVGKIWIVYGIVSILLGLPLLLAQKSLIIIISILGMVLENIVAMYKFSKIEDKYRIY